MFSIVDSIKVGSSIGNGESKWRAKMKNLGSRICHTTTKGKPQKKNRGQSTNRMRGGKGLYTKEKINFFYVFFLLVFEGLRGLSTKNRTFFAASQSNPARCAMCM